MAAISRIRVAWTGTGVVGGGVSTFYSEGAASLLQTAVKAFFADTNLRTQFPTAVTWTVPADGDTFESTTGLIGTPWSSGTAGTTSGTAATPFAAGVGARIVWNTAGIRNRRRVRGSTYLCPLSTNAYDGDGSIHPSGHAYFQTAAQALIVALGDDLCIWSRPATGASDGAIWTVLSRTVPDKVSWLSSRRN